MTKSKKNFAIIMALAILLALFGSLFAIFGMQKPNMVVEAATETREPGLLYDSTFTSWADLVSSGKISVDGGHLQVNEDLEGDLVCGEVNGLTSLRSAFSGCSKLTSIDCRKLDTSKVTDMSNMFNSCFKSTWFGISNFDTSKVTDMSGMFNRCSAVTALNVSNFDTSNVTNMNYMFYNCSSLTSLTFGSNFNTSKVADMRSMFSSCSKLTSLNVSNFNTSNVTDMDHMFQECSSLISLDLSSFNTSKVADMEYMFSSCSSLTTLDVSNFDTSSVTNMNYMFSDCSSLTSLDVSNFNTSSVTNMNYMFSDCSSLTSLDVSNFDTSKVTDMQYMFSGCSSLVSLDLSNFNTSNVTDMNSMFSWCSSLKSLDLSNFDTSNVTIMNSMFFDCSSLNTLDISNFDTSNVADMSFMFAGCSFKTLNLRGKFVIPSDCMVDMMFTNLDAGIEFVCNMFKITLSEEQVNTVKGLPTPVSRAMKLANIALGKEVEPDELSNMIGKEIYDMFIIFLNDTTICEITLPTTVGTDVTLAPATGMFYAYTASDGDAQTTLPASSDGKTKLTLYKKVGETAEPVPFPSGQDTPSTGVVADLSMLVIAVASILSLAIIATKKKRVAR